MKQFRYRRMVGDLLGSSTRNGGPRTRSAREVEIRAHRGPHDRASATTYTGLTRPNRYY